MLLRARSNAWRVVVFNSRACGDSPVTTPQTSFQDLLQKQEGDRAMWEYPFAVAGVNITFMLIQMLDLEAVKPRNLVGATFLKFLAENESAFDILYCITFKLMDHQWLAMHFVHGFQYGYESHKTSTGNGTFDGRHNSAGGFAFLQSS